MEGVVSLRRSSMMRFASVVLLHAAVLLFPLLAVAQTPAAAPPPAAPVPRPSLASAERMLIAARAKATEDRVELSCAVVDARGDLVGAFRMDGASFLTMEIARAKATTSALTGQPSGGLGERAAQISTIGSVAGVAMVAVQGALPIVQDNRRVGGIGCSGAPAQVDENAARAGLGAAAAR